MKERTLRFILDSIFFGDAMSPEFKKANDILLRIVKMNDRTDGLPHTRLVEINKAFKANDPKAARAAFDKLKPLIAKGDKDLADGLAEAKSKLTEAMQKAERTKAAAVAAKGAVALFDRFRKAIDGVKAKPAGASKLSAYSDKLKAYGDFSKRVAQIAQMAAAKKDVSKQADMLASACDRGKARADRERAKAEKEYAAAKDRVSVFREMEKIRTRKIAEFAKQKGEVQSLGDVLPGDIVEAETGDKEKLRKRLVEYLKKIGNTAIDAKKEYDAQRSLMRKAHMFDARDYLRELMSDVLKKAKEVVKTWNHENAENLLKDLSFAGSVDLDHALSLLQNIGANNREIKPLLRKPINFIQRLNRLYDEAREKKYGGSVSYDLAHYIREVKDPIRASYFMLHDPRIKSELVSKLNQLGIDDTQFFISRLQSGYLAF